MYHCESYSKESEYHRSETVVMGGRRGEEERTGGNRTIGAAGV